MGGGIAPSVNFDLLYCADYYKDTLKKQHFVDKHLSFLQIENAYCLPSFQDGEKTLGGICTKDKTFIRSSALHAFTSGVYNFDEKKAIQKDETVIYVGMFINIWGHLVTDCIKHFWFLKSKEYKEKYSSLPLIYLSYDKPFQFTKEVQTLYKMLDIPWQNFICVNQITCYKKIIIPEPCFSYYYTDKDNYIDGEGNYYNNSNYYTKEYKNMIEQIKNAGKKQLVPTGINKIYLSYRHYAKRHAKGRVTGEEKLEAFFKKQGYKVIYPEEYSFEKQLNLMLNCKYLATTDGSCAHNSLFMNEGSNIIIIPRACYITGYQLAIIDVAKLNATYIDSSLSVFTEQKAPWRGPLCYYVSENLMKYFNYIPSQKHFWHSNLKPIKKYILTALSLRLRLLIAYHNNKKPAKDFCNRFELSPPSFYKKKFLECFLKYLYSSALFKFMCAGVFVFKKIRDNIKNLLHR